MTALKTSLLFFLLFLARGTLAATVGLPESWGNGDAAGWTAQDLVEQTPTALQPLDGTLGLNYGAQTVKRPPEERLLRTTDTNPVDRWTGDYHQAGVCGITFRLRASHAARVRLLLGCGDNGSSWAHGVSVARTGAWVTVYAPLDPVAWRGDSTAPAAEAFASDLRDVRWIGIAIQRNSSTNAQEYRLDDVTLQSLDPEYAQWMLRCDDGSGRCLAPELDLDNDGVNNWQEWIAGTAADNPLERLTLHAAPGVTGPQLQWRSATGRFYRVLSAATPRGPFSELASSLAATPPWNEFRDSPANAGVRFYRLQAMLEAP